MHNTIIRSFMLAAFSFFTLNTFAQTSWNGLVSTDWNTAGNWSAGIPDPADDVTIPSAGNKPVIGAGTVAVAKSVRITVAAAQLTISNTASLSINGSTGFALENYGTLDNSGTIQIGNTASIMNRGIVHRNGGTLNNKPGGLIQIDRSSAAEAFYSTGIVNNEGIIQIGGNAAVVGHGIKMEGNTFNNKPGGFIKIDRTSVHGIDMTNTTPPVPVLNNEGSIQIGSQANVTGLGIVVRAGCTVNNKPGGSVTIDRTGGNGIEVTGAAAVLNNEALIQIGTQANVGGTALVNRNGCTFNNKLGGDIQINKVNGSIYNNGTFVNSALITVDNDTRKAQDGIFNDGAGNFTNNATGIISIQKPWGNGIWNNFGNFTNAGKITIRDIYNVIKKNYSTGILNYGTFSSTSSAEIHLDEVGGGIISIGAVTNAGIIRMGENAALSAMGILNIQANGVFSNNGDISIKQTARGAIQNTAPASFFNNACAQIAIFDTLKNTSTFINSGLLRVNTPTETHINTALTNNGVIEYAPGSFFIPNVTNNEIIVSSTISGDCQKVSPAFHVGNPLDFIVEGVYTDADATISAGTYTAATNTFTPNAGLINGDSYNFFVKIKDGTGGCSRIVAWKVTVKDNIPPSISCPGNRTVSTDAGLCSSVQTYTVTANDNCFNQVTLTRLNGPASGSTFPRGTHIISFRATDGVGLSATCTFRITVNDNERPTITCPSNMVKNTDNNLCTSVTTYSVTGADNCTSVSISRVGGFASGSAFPKGISTVTWRATDIAGNSTLCSFTVTVSDAQQPAITCPTSINTNTSPGQCNKTVFYATPSHSDNCSGASVNLFSGLASGSVFPTGTSTVIWRAIDQSANSNNCSFTVTVTDNEQPTITCPPAATVAGSGSPCGYPASQLSPATATDNCAVTSLTNDAPTTLPAGPTTITWTAKDAANNQKTCAYVVTVNCGASARDEVGSMKYEDRYEVGSMKKKEGSDVRASSLIPHTSSLTLFPNPASDMVVITWSDQQINSKSNQHPSGSDQHINNKSHQQQIIIYDTWGRIVWQQKVPAEARQLQVDLSGAMLADGIYRVLLRTEAGTLSKKLVLSKL